MMGDGRMTADGSSLREAKRAATRRTLATTTYEMVLERGLDQVTVEDVTSAVQLSRRTFSNYFACKEEAVAEVLVQTVQDGLAGWTPPDGHDLLDSVRSLVLHQFSGDFPAVLASFRRLCADHPGLVPYWNDALWRMWDLTSRRLRAEMRPADTDMETDLAMVMGALYGVVSSHFAMTALPDGSEPEHRSMASAGAALTRVFARLEVALGQAGDEAVRALGTPRGPSSLHRRAEIDGSAR